MEQILHLLICYGETQFLGFSFEHCILNELVPYHILHLISLSVGEVVAALCHLDDVGVFIDKVLVFLYIDFFT